MNVNVRCVFFIAGEGRPIDITPAGKIGENSEFFSSLFRAEEKSFIGGSLENDDDDGAGCVREPGRETESEISKKVMDRRQWRQQARTYAESDKDAIYRGSAITNPPNQPIHTQSSPPTPNLDKRTQYPTSNPGHTPSLRPRLRLLHHQTCPRERVTSTDTMDLLWGRSAQPEKSKKVCVAFGAPEEF